MIRCLMSCLNRHRTPALSRVRRSHSARGFTLVELVIATAILSIILTITYSSLAYIIRTKKLLDDRREIGSIANAVLQRVSKEIQLAQDQRLMGPAPSGWPAGSPAPKLLGTSKTLDNSAKGDSLQFTADEAGQYVPGELTNAGMVEITYRVEKDPDSPKGAPSSYLLIRDETPKIRPIKRAYERTMTFPIARNVVRLQFSYYDRSTNRWQNEWDGSKTELPGLIRLVLTLRSPLGVEHEYMTVLPIRPK